MLSILSYVSGSLYVLLGEVSVQVLCPLFNWVACLPGVELCEFFIYFGDPSLVICTYIFPYGWFPFHFTYVFFSCAKAFYFDEVPFVYSFLMSLALGDISVKIDLCYIHIYHISLSILLFMDTSRFHILTVMHNVAMNMGVQIYLQSADFSSFGSSTRSGLMLDNMVVLVLIFKGSLILYFIVGAPIYIPTKNEQEFSSFHILSNSCHLLSLW